jgi:uncharacterized protein (TIGR02246 family)
MSSLDSSPQRPALRARINAFVDAFNVNNLDAVMTFFSNDAVYRPGDGKEHRGKAAIRKAFQPQFSGAYGKMRFDELDRLVDEEARKATIRWICHHDFRGAYGARVPLLMRTFYRLLMQSERGGWQGLDVFHFDAAGYIVGKFSYSEASRPLLDRKYGVPL